MHRGPGAGGAGGGWLRPESDRIYRIAELTEFLTELTMKNQTKKAEGKVVVVYGPKESGKTINTETLKQFFGCDVVVDEGKQRLPKSFDADKSTLVLTWPRQMREEMGLKTDLPRTAIRCRISTALALCEIAGLPVLRPKV